MQTTSIYQQFRKDFQAAYPYIYSFVLTDEDIDIFLELAKNNWERALDLAQDHLLSQGLCDIEE
jgi:hypothetical protein